MGDFISVSFDKREINDFFDDLSKEAQRATVNTTNTITTKIDKQIREVIKKTYLIGKSSVDKVKRIQRANVRAGNPFATIFIIKKGRGLIKYNAKQEPHGVSYKVGTLGAGFVPGASISTWKKDSPDEFVYVRDKRVGSYRKRSKIAFVKGNANRFVPFEDSKIFKRTKRLSLQGPRIADLYTSKRSGAIIDKVIDKDYETTLNKKVNEQFEKRR